MTGSLIRRHTRAARVAPSTARCSYCVHEGRAFLLKTSLQPVSAAHTTCTVTRNQRHVQVHQDDAEQEERLGAAAAAAERQRRDRGRPEESRRPAEEGAGHGERGGRDAAERRGRRAEAAAEPTRQSRLPSQVVVSRSLPAAPGRDRAREEDGDRWGARREALGGGDVAEAGHAPGIAGSARFAGRLGAHAQHIEDPHSRCRICHIDMRCCIRCVAGAGKAEGSCMYAHAGRGEACARMPARNGATTCLRASMRSQIHGRPSSKGYLCFRDASWLCAVVVLCMPHSVHYIVPMHEKLLIVSSSSNAVGTRMINSAHKKWDPLGTFHTPRHLRMVTTHTAPFVVTTSQAKPAYAMQAAAHDS